MECSKEDALIVKKYCNNNKNHKKQHHDLFWFGCPFGVSPSSGHTFTAKPISGEICVCVCVFERECTILDESEYIHFFRFFTQQNDTHATLQYLLQTMEQLPNVEELTHQLLDPQPQNTIVTTSDEIAAPNASADGSTTTMLGDVLLPEFEVSSVIPRGKYNCTVHTNGLCLQSKTVASDCIYISSSAVQYAIVFPTPEDCVKAVLIASPKPTAARRPPSKKRKSSIDDDDNDEDGEDTAEMIISPPNNTPISTTRQGRMILLCFSSPVVVSAAAGVANKKPKTYTHVCFPLSSFIASEDGYKQEESCISSLESALKVSLFRISLPNSIMKSGNRGDHFQFISDKEQSTSTTTSGMPFVKCHKGVQDGALYPMEEGLLFYKLRVFFYIYYRFTCVVHISSLFGTIFDTFIQYI
jgi:hypothetical protein